MSKSFKLPFDWDQHFVWSSDGTKCLGACALMAARYWGIQLSDIECQRILTDLAVPAFQGADARQIIRAIQQTVGSTPNSDPSLETRLDDFINSGTFTVPSSPKTRISLKQDFFHSSRVDTLRAAFEATKPIPQIVIYDDLLASLNIESFGGHAALVEAINFDTGFIYLIDPNAQKRRSATYFNFDDFRRGWKSFEQATIILYPAGSYRTVQSVTMSLGLGSIIE